MDFTRIDENNQNTTWTNYFKNVLIPPVKDYLQALIKVKYPVQGLLQFPANTALCGFDPLPQYLVDGIATDMVIFFGSFIDESTGPNDTITTGSSGACYRNLNAYKRRPLLATSDYNNLTLDVVDPTEDPLTHEIQTVRVLHEIFHCLAFNGAEMANFVNPQGLYYGNGIFGTYYLGATAFPYINVQPLTNKVREFFNCSSLPGLIFENGVDGESGGIHLERQFFGTEFMSTGDGPLDARISEISLAFLEGSGWYIPDYTMADSYLFGKGKGCPFIFYSQSSANAVYNTSEHCTNIDSYACNTEGLVGGQCSDLPWTDGSNIYLPKTRQHCHSEEEDNDQHAFSLQSRGRYSESRCFNGNLYDQNKTGTDFTYCFNYQCLNNNTLLKVKVGTEYYNCTSKAKIPVQINNPSNYLYCPDPKQFCSTKGKMYCLRGCMGRGDCIDGQCQCYSGYAGLDCGINI